MDFRKNKLEKDKSFRNMDVEEIKQDEKIRNIEIWSVGRSKNIGNDKEEKEKMDWTLYSEEEVNSEGMGRRKRGKSRPQWVNIISANNNYEATKRITENGEIRITLFKKTCLLARISLKMMFLGFKYI